MTIGAETCLAPPKAEAKPEAGRGPASLMKAHGWSLAVLGPVAALGASILLDLKEMVLGEFPAAAEIGLSALALALLLRVVFIAQRHAEAIALRIGEPGGTLVLTFAVTAIEATVILSIMLDGSDNPSLARESAFSTVMIVCAGVLGACLTLGGWRHGHQDLKRQGTTALLSVAVALSVLTLILPNFTLTSDAGSFSTAQLVFVSTLCLLLYGSFVLTQTGRHKGDFVDDPREKARSGHHVAATKNLPRSLVLLAVGLVGIVLLADHVASGLEERLVSMRVQQTDAIVGSFIAMLVLLPESVAAIRASLNNELQRSLNIALGSACATIGLTVPIVGIVGIATGSALTLGLGPGDTVLLLLGLALSVISFGTGQTTVLTGAVHLVVFVAYLMLIAIP